MAFEALMSGAKAQKAARFHIQYESNTWIASWHENVGEKVENRWETSIKLRTSGKRVTFSTNMPPIPQKSTTPHTSFSKSMLQSIVQKAIRRRMPKAASKAAAELCRGGTENILVLARRLPIICLEDAIYHPIVPLCVFLTAALSKDYIPNTAMISSLVQATAQIASSTVYDSISPTESPLTLFPTPCNLSTVSLLLRAEFGGMPHDVDMLRRGANLWQRRFQHPHEQAPPSWLLHQKSLPSVGSKRSLEGKYILWYYILWYCPTKYILWYCPTKYILWYCPTKKYTETKLDLWSDAVVLVHSMETENGLERYRLPRTHVPDFEVGVCGLDDPKSYLDAIPDPDPRKLPLEGLDFHCSNVLEGIADDDISKQAMWECSSGVNRRIVLHPSRYGPPAVPPSKASKEPPIPAGTNPAHDLLSKHWATIRDKVQSKALSIALDKCKHP